MHNILLIIFMIGLLVDLIMVSPFGICWLVDYIGEHKICYPIIIVFTISPILAIISVYLGF